MDKKVLYALTSKIFNTLKKLGIKPKIGVTTGVKRLPGSRNSFNTDLSKLEGGDPEGLKRLIANDADFLPQATPDEIAQYNNNLEYLQSTFPEVFSKPQVVTEAKTGIKTLVDDVGEKIKKPTKEDYEDYAEILNDSENTVVQGTETFDELEALVKKQKDYEASMYQEYKMGKLDPAPGEKSQNRLNFLRKKADEAEMTKDRRLISMDEIQELEDLEGTFQPRTINISDPKTAEDLISGIGTMFRKRGR
jgi:cell division protein ZapA (FtsZ GTPase activity inhibitor)